MADGKWDGLDAALAKMKGLPDKLKKGAFRRAGTKAMRLVRDAARKSAARFDDPSSPSNISKNIVTRAGSRKDERRYGGNVVVTKVGVQGGARPKKGREDTGHWRLLEFGTSKMRAQPFMRDALESNADLVTSVYSSALGPEIDKALR